MLRRTPATVLGLALALALAVPLGAAPAAAAEPVDPATAILDPIPEQPIVSGIGLTLRELATFPKSEPVPAPTDPRLKRHARINHLSELPDGSGRLAVPDLNGTLYLVTGGTPVPYLDLKAAVGADFFSGRGLGAGFGFVAFHPDFRRTGLFYTMHTEALGALTAKTPDYGQTPAAQHGVITEWTAADPRAATFAGTSRELLRIGFRNNWHGLQEIGFNPTARRGSEDHGKLYIAVGDGGAGVGGTDQQSLAMPHGKILRIDPRGTNSPNGRYGIPAANPYAGRAGALGEVWASGLRNPHRFSWDSRWPHRMYIGNIGEHNIEAIYEAKAGDNFGWPLREGQFVITPNDPTCSVYPLPADDAKFGFTYPVAAYDHDRPAGSPRCSDSGDAVIGGFVVRRPGLLNGKYVFGDDVTGQLWYTEASEMRRGKPIAARHELMLFDPAGKRTTLRELAGDARVDLRLGQDADGRIYLVSKANGKIWQVTGARRFAGCATGRVEITRTAGARNWAPVTPAKWRFTRREVVLAEAGVARPGPRRPFEYAVLTRGPALSSVDLRASVRLDTPVEITNRDVILVFGYRSDTQFSYAHLSTDNTIYPHNGIFVVADADRLRVDDQWTGAVGATPAITDAAWHDVRVKHCAGTGETAVYVDGSATPLMTAVVPQAGAGRVGFGSFDNIGRARDLTVRGTRAAE